MPADSQSLKTVFIIDDNVMMRSMLRLGANEAELPVLGEAGTIQAASTRCTELEPDIVLLDLGLPDGNGLDLLSELKARNPSTYVIIVSAKNDQEVVRDAVTRGAKGFIVKPFSIGTVTDALVTAKRKLGCN